MESDHRVVLKLLDTFSLHIDGVEIQRFHSNRERILLAYLALQNGVPSARSELAQLVWAGYLYRSAQGSLRGALSHLRKMLAVVPGLLVVTRYAVRLNVHHPQFSCDVLHEDIPDSSVLLSSFEFVDSGPLQEWLLQTRQQLHTGDATTHTKGAHVESIGNLPTRLTPLVGREEEWLQLTGILARGQQRLIVLSGVGGVGKTSLAIAAARSMRDRFVDGVWFYSMVGVSAESISHEAIATQLITLLESTPNPAEPSIDQLVRQLYTRRLLLLVDNMEHMLHLTPLLEHLIGRTKHLRILVTSRAALPTKNAETIVLRGLSMENDSESAAALALFQTVAKQLGYVIPKGAKTEQRLRALTSALLIEPLAIELMAANRTPTELLEQRNRPPSNKFDQSASAALMRIWQQLDPALQACLMTSTVFRGTFSQQAATRITKATPAQLTRLADLFLLQRQKVTHTSNVSYSLHPLIDRFAQQKMDAALLSETQRQHAHYYLTEVAALEDEIMGQAPRKTGRRLQGDLKNIHAAWEFALNDERWHEIDQALNTLVALYKQIGLYAEARSRLLATHAALTPQPTPFAYQLWLRVRIALLTFSPKTEALLSEVETLSQLIESQNLMQLQAVITFWRAYLTGAVQANFEAANTLYQHGLLLAETLGDKRLMARILAQQMQCLMFLMKPDAASATGQRMLQIARDNGDLQQEVEALRSLTKIAYMSAHFRRSLTLFQGAFAAAKKLEHSGLKNQLILTRVAILVETETLELSSADRSIIFDYSYAADVAPNSITRYELARAAILTRSGQFEQARTILEPLMAIRDTLPFPNPANLLLNDYTLALFEERFEDLYEITIANRQLSSNSHHIQIAEMMRGRALMWLGRYTEAIETLGTIPQAFIEIGDVHLGLEYMIVKLWSAWQLSGKLSAEMATILTVFLDYLQTHEEALCGMLDPVRACLCVRTILEQLGRLTERDLVTRKASEWIQRCLATTENARTQHAFLTNIPSHVVLHSIAPN